MVREILKLGDSRLYQKSRPIEPEEFEGLPALKLDLHDTLMAYRERHGAGRAIAAPQIGDFRRAIYLNAGGAGYLFVNPTLQPSANSTFFVRDDCMSFPGLTVEVQRYTHIRFSYDNPETGERVKLELGGDLAELLQHEYDHLDGILATMRAKDNKAFYMD